MNLYKWKEELRGKKIYIWGASIGGSQAFKCLEKNGLRIEAYCDNDSQKQGGLCNGKRIISPNYLKEIRGDNLVVIIASYAYEVIYEQIQKMGINCEVYIYLLYDPCHLKVGREYTQEEKDEIRCLYSSESYTNKLIDLILEQGFLNSNGFGNINQYRGFGGIDKYYYDNVADRILDNESILTLLDVGAYVGDSVLQMQEVFGNRVCRVYGFEPNEENCEEIIKKQINDFVLFRYALGKVNSYINFSERGPFFRASEKEDGVSTKVARLDDLDINIKGQCILKLDIEGSEMDCLEGAKEFIKKYKPYIAVCVYHMEKDILEIPRFIQSLMPNCNFLLRGGMHTVCYVFPDEDI